MPTFNFWLESQIRKVISFCVRNLRISPFLGAFTRVPDNPARIHDVFIVYDPQRNPKSTTEPEFEFCSLVKYNLCWVETAHSRQYQVLA